MKIMLATKFWSFFAPFYGLIYHHHPTIEDFRKCSICSSYYQTRIDMDISLSEADTSILHRIRIPISPVTFNEGLPADTSPINSDHYCYKSPDKYHVVRVSNDGMKAQCVFCGHEFEVGEGEEEEGNWIPEDSCLNNDSNTKFSDICFASPSQRHKWEPLAEKLIARCVHCGVETSYKKYRDSQDAEYIKQMANSTFVTTPSGTSPYLNGAGGGGGYGGGSGGGAGGLSATYSPTVSTVASLGSSLTFRNLQSAVDSVTVEYDEA